MAEQMATLADVMKYFEIDGPTFRKEWKELSAQDKEDLKKGVGNGSLTY